DPRDVFCCLSAKRIEELPPGAKIGTSSLRRRCQLLELRGDLKIEMLRGNIDTRLRKLRDGLFDAIILASAGLRRTGLFNEAEMVMLEPDQMLPAPGQGALAMQCRRNDSKTRDLLSALDDSATERCVTAERVIVAALGGDCHSPIGALAQIEGEQMTLRAAVGSRGGTPPVARAAAIGSAGHSDGALAGVLKSLSEQNVAAMLAGR